MIVTPKFSIVMPSYNQAEFIQSAIKSVLAQEFLNWELLIIDNNSNEATVNAIDLFQDPRIRVIKISNGGVIAKSRNLGIINASAPWIAFLDSDDIWYPSKLRKIHEFTARQDINLIYHDLDLIKNDKIVGKVKARRTGRNIHRKLLLHGNFIGNSSVTVRKTVLHNVGLITEEKDLIGVEDFHTWLKISRETSGFIYLKKNLGGYRVHESNSSHRSSITDSDLVTKDFSVHASELVRKRIKSRRNYLEARECMKKGDFSRAQILFPEVVRDGVLSRKVKSLIFMSILKFRNFAKSTKL